MTTRWECRGCGARCACDERHVRCDQARDGWHHPISGHRRDFTMTFDQARRVRIRGL